MEKQQKDKGKEIASKKQRTEIKAEVFEIKERLY